MAMSPLPTRVWGAIEVNSVGCVSRVVAAGVASESGAVGARGALEQRATSVAVASNPVKRAMRVRNPDMDKELRANDN